MKSNTAARLRSLARQADRAIPNWLAALFLGAGVLYLAAAFVAAM